MSTELQWQRRRSAGSGALTVLGALLLAVEPVQVCAIDTFFDANRFAGTAATNAAQPRERLIRSAQRLCRSPASRGPRAMYALVGFARSVLSLMPAGLTTSTRISRRRVCPPCAP
jgi:hypothetical protein